MNTKTIVTILIVGVIFLAGASSYLLLKPSLKKDIQQSQNESQTVDKKEKIIIINDAITPKIAPFVEVTITSNGFSPAKVTLSKGGVIHFINKTSRPFEIVSEGKLSVAAAPIEAGKTVVSLPLFETGEYILSLKGNPNIKGVVLVK